MRGCDEGGDGVRSGPGRWHGLLMHARNRIPVPRGIIEGHWLLVRVRLYGLSSTIFGSRS